MSEFNPETLDADDPGLTAFALGELEGADAEQYADRVRRSPELQALVQQIQSEGQLLSEELRLEPIEPLTSDRRATIVAHAAVALPTQSTVTRASSRSLWIRWLAMTAGSAAVITGIAIALPRAQTSKVALDDMAKHETLTKRGTVSGMEAGPKYESKAEVVDLASPATVGSSPLPRQREPIHGIEQNMVLEADGAALKVTDELSDVDFDATSLATTSASSARRAAAPADEKGPKGDRGAVARSQFKTAKVTADSSEVRFGEKPGESNSLGLQPSEPQSSVSTLEALGFETKPVSGPQTGTPLGKAKENNSERRSKSGKPEPTGFTANGDKAKGEVRGRVSVSDKDSKGIDGSKLATVSDSVQGEAKKSESYARRYENLAKAEQDNESIAPTRSSGPAKPDASTPKAAGFSALTDLYDGERHSPDSRKKVYSEKTEKQNVAKDADFALVELSRARESERLRPGSIPLEELQKLERASETEARQRRLQADPTGAEAYQPIFENSFVSPAKEPQSTFSIDVDSASYSNMRRFLMSGQVPPPDAIRIEELVNYFSYQYPVPQDGKPFSVNTDIAACPWNPGHHLVRIGLKGKEIAKDQRPPSSLVFLVDVSGSMSAENKLPLVKSSLKTLVSQLDERDRIAIVTYAGEAGLRLPATSVAQRDTILAAIDGLGAGGSTNGAAGINTAYDIAAKEFVEKGTNRVILCTDGDFNVGVTTNAALEDMITTRAKGGVFLSVFGFGMGNLKDNKLEGLADKGNGQYGYIDDRQEADKVFVQELSGTLVTIAKDVKIQIDFDAEAVASYRLVGYENRVLATEDFNNDKKDAGEIGAGHTVTALYEIIPVKDLKPNDKTRWMNVKLRYKQPEASTSELIENPLVGQPGQLKLASSDFQFAAAVASFGMLLRHSQHAGQANWGMVKELAQSGLSNDQFGHRSGFRRLVDQAESLVGERRPVAPPEPESTVNGKYKSLLRRLNVPEDAKQYGQFKDYGFDQTKAYGGSDNLPEGYWVYVAPYWYIWGETSQK